MQNYLQSCTTHSNIYISCCPRIRSVAATRDAFLAIAWPKDSQCSICLHLKCKWNKLKSNLVRSHFIESIQQCCFTDTCRCHSCSNCEHWWIGFGLTQRCHCSNGWKWKISSPTFSNWNVHAKWKRISQRHAANRRAHSSNIWWAVVS